MKLNNNIKIIEDYISNGNEDNCLFINQVNDEIACFYEYIIKKIALNKNTKIANCATSDQYLDASNDLFQKKTIYIYYLTNTKKIQEIASGGNPKIILTDYKNYKKFVTKYKCLSGYDFEKDLNYFFKEILKIDNKDLIDFCLSYPFFSLSEETKYMISKDNYVKDTKLNISDSSILEIRKEAFQMKMNRSNLKNFLDILKKEVIYKKFSFLAY